MMFLVLVLVSKNVRSVLRLKCGEFGVYVRLAVNAQC